MLTDRANAICLLRVLQDYSDAEHILPMREIVSKLKTVYDLSVDRRTVYGAVALLISLGYDISDYEDNGKGYFLRERAFEASEVRLLTDALYAFPFIPAKQTNDLVNKLQEQVSIPQRRRFRHIVPLRSDRKTDNKSVFLNIEVLEEAISKRVQVQFDYLQYELDKQLHPRRADKYTAEPYTMVCANEHYYLVCRYVGHTDISFYRIDLMRNIALADAPSEPNAGWHEIADKAVYAFTGEPETIRLRCRNYVIGDVLDKFGSDIHIVPADADCFITSFTAAPYGILFWALQYLPHVEVLEPESLRNSVIAALQRNPYFEAESK